ncbi:MAG: glycosyltransferase [bacterium]
MEFSPKGLRVALVHEWLADFGGSEATLLHFLDMFPHAPLYLLFYDRSKWNGALGRRDVHSSFLQHIPGIRRYYRNFLPLFPFASESLSVGAAELVISGSHAVAKSVKPPSGAFHVCYCYTPMRYIYDQSETYLASLPAWARPAARATFDQIRPWDVSTAGRVNHFIAISKFVAGRIDTYYHREAEVIYPPVDTDFFQPLPSGSTGLGGDYFLLVSRLVPYKGVEVAVEAFRRLDHRLKIVGRGPQEAVLKRGAPPNVEYLGSLPREQLRDLYRGARALIFPSIEDFGIAPVEAMACGIPVIAYAEGGALETVVPGATGLLFSPRTPASLAAVVQEFDRHKLDPSSIRRYAERFSAPRFRNEFKASLTRHGFHVG